MDQWEGEPEALILVGATINLEFRPTGCTRTVTLARSPHSSTIIVFGPATCLDELFPLHQAERGDDHVTA
jgi:hypothetical protein